MASLIGTHNRTNGIKQIPSRAVLSLNGAGLGGDETHADTITVLRDMRVFPGEGGETAPDFNTYDGSDWPAYGRYWYQERTEDGGNFKAAWDKNPADYYQIQNERGGGGTDEFAMQRTVDIERSICWAANADGRKCGILNLAGGSPDFESWKRIYVPFIMEAWEHGQNPYCRHAYADKFVNDDGSIVPGQPQRVMDELEYLRSIGYGGGVILTECGLFGGYGVANYDYFEQQVTAWEQALRPYADILIGLAWWELGSSEFNADYTAHLKQLLPYIQAGNLPRWTPPIVEPPNGGGDMKKKWLMATRHMTEEIKPNYARIAFFKKGSDGQSTDVYISKTDDFELPEGADVVSLVLLRDEPADPNPPPSVLTLPAGSKGVDVSYWQGAYNWADSGAEFGIIRCSDGMTANSATHDENGIDRQFWANADKLTALGIPWAIYHFLRPGSIQAQADKVRGALLQLAQNGTLPQTAVFDDGTWLPELFIDVEDGALTNQHVLDFFNALSFDFTIGIYTGKPIWELITSGAAVWWSDVPLWIAAYGANDGNIPNWPDGPNLPRGWSKALLWQYTSIPLDKNIAGPYPLADKPSPPTPPTGQTVDVLPYFQPLGQFGRYVVFHFDDGRTQAQQMEKLPDGRTILWKGEGQWIDGKQVFDYEEILVDAEGVKKFKDTSSGGRSAYDLAGIVWVPRFVEIGKVYQSSPTVRELDRVTCQTTASNPTTDYIYAKALLPTWTSPYDPAITFNDVLVFEWRKTPDINTPPIEVYKLAPDVCYAEWNNGAVGELPQGRQPLSFQLTNCA